MYLINRQSKAVLQASTSTHLILGSLLERNFPRMLTASTRSPLSDSTAMIVFTHSYSTALPACFKLKLERND